MTGWQAYNPTVNAEVMADSSLRYAFFAWLAEVSTVDIANISNGYLCSDLNDPTRGYLEIVGGVIG